MIDVNYLRTFCLRLIRKNQSGSLSVADFEQFWNDSQAAYMEDLLGRFQNRNNGKAGSNTGLIENETILTKLSPFISPVSLTITGGNADKPIDLKYRLALRINGVDAKKINQNQIASVNNSVIDAPSVTNSLFYFVEYEDYYYLLPHTLPTVTITTAELDYVKEVTNIVWGYTWDANDRQVYNAGTSVQPQWGDTECREITKRMLKTIGVSFKDADFANFGQSVIAAGE